MRPSTPPSWGPVDTAGGQPTTASTDGRWFGLSLAGVRTRRNPIVHDDTAQSSGRRHHRTRLVILSTASRAVSSHARQSVVATWTDRHNGGVGVPLSEMTGHVRCSQESVQGADGSTRTYVTVSRQGSSAESRPRQTSPAHRPSTSASSAVRSSRRGPPAPLEPSPRGRPGRSRVSRTNVRPGRKESAAWLVPRGGHTDTARHVISNRHVRRSRWLPERVGRR